MQKLFSKGHTPFVLLVGLAVIGVSFIQQPQGAFTSSEVHFADASPSGMQIVPASCPSGPHWVGACTTTQDQCTLSATLNSGNGTVNLVWYTGTLSGYDESQYTIGGTLPPLGYVYPAGNMNVTAPAQPTTYTYSVWYSDLSGDTIRTTTCTASVAGTGSSNPLYINKVIVGGTSVNPGDIIHYRVYIENGGSSAVSNLNVRDVIPPNTTYVWQGGGTDTNSNGVSGGALTWQQVTAPIGWYGYVDFTVRVNAGVAAGTQICNKATISAQGIAGVDSGTVCSTVTSAPTCTIWASPSEDYGGYKAYSGINDQHIDASGANICVTNSGGNHYFIPAKTPQEIQSFQNAANAGTVPGASYTPAP